MHHGQRLARFTLGQRFAQANDRGETCAMRCFGLGTHNLVGFTVIGAAFGMANDHGRCAGVGQHLGRNVARMSAGGG
jgi:hypothetical protein